MISTQNIVDKINARLSCGGLSDLQTCQLNGALAALNSVGVVSVTNLVDLPSAAEYAGRLVYVTAINSYRYSDGRNWSADFSSTLTSYPSIWTWGNATGGRLGNNSVVNQSSPVSIVGGFCDWVSISSIQGTTAALRSNGTIWAWGVNSDGRLGDGTILDASSPVSVIGGITDWCQVSLGVTAAAIRANGTMWAWGANSYGAVGDDTIVNKCSPVSVIGGFTDWCQVSAANQFVVAVRTNGSAWAWGRNNCGQLGDGTTVNKSSPVSIIGGFTDWCHVSAGLEHGVGIRKNGTVWSWGSNTCGRLGDGTIVSRSSPVSVVGGFTDWCQVRAGQLGSGAVRANGTAWAWGQGNSGQLGDGTVNDRSSPVSVVGGFTDWCYVAMASIHTLGIRQNGTVWAWGTNGAGHLGDGTTVCRSSPVSVVGGFTDWCGITVGGQHSVAIRAGRGLP